jgi:hypothetical protein
MTTATRERPVDRFFDGLIERQATIFDVIRSSNDRYHRFTRSLIEGARQGGLDWTEVARRFAARPTDIVGVYEAVADAIGNGQARVLALAREWLDDLVESQRESRDIFRRGLGDVREAVERVQERVQERAPGFMRRGGDRQRQENGQEEPVAGATE